MAQARMQIKIEKDGKIRITTNDAIPQQHHKSADELLAFIQKMAGGKRETTKLREGHVHLDEEQHEHIHQH